MKLAIFLLFAAGLSGCQTANQWTRADGKLIADDATLVKQLELDRLACEGEVSKANMSAGSNFGMNSAASLQNTIVNVADQNIIRRGCMANKGYVQQTSG